MRVHKQEAQRQWEFCISGFLFYKHTLTITWAHLGMLTNSYRFLPVGFINEPWRLHKCQSSVPVTLKSDSRNQKVRGETVNGEKEEARSRNHIFLLLPATFLLQNMIGWKEGGRGRESRPGAEAPLWSPVIAWPLTVQESGASVLQPTMFKFSYSQSKRFYFGWVVIHLLF